MNRALRTRSLTIALAGALLAAAPAWAEDPRLVDRLYDPDEIVRVDGKANVQTTIRFAANERIENVAIGDSTSWQVTPNRRANLLFVKPLAARASTNMTVVTDKRTYLFDLVANPAHRNPLYVLAFDYPIDLEAVELVGQAAPVEVAAASDPYAVLDPATLNFAWATAGKRALLPERVFDDGQATFLAWPIDTALPAILVKDEEGTEGPVNFAVRGDVIVVDGVPREIILRSGEERATLVNEGPVRPAQPHPSALAQAPSPSPGSAAQAEAEQ
jgi:type IV secretion system protein VirB9